MQGRLTVAVAQRQLLAEGDSATFVELLRQGSLGVEFYRPRDRDLQQPHSRDEVYFVVAGTGAFVCGGRRQQFEPGEILVVPAGVAHRFEDFSADFATWVLFYGPEGGEAAEDATP